MNVQNPHRNEAANPHAAARRERHERTFGTGYGNSSGYAAPRSYAAGSSMRTFRFA